MAHLNTDAALKCMAFVPITGKVSTSSPRSWKYLMRQMTDDGHSYTSTLPHFHTCVKFPPTLLRPCAA